MSRRPPAQRSPSTASRKRTAWVRWTLIAFAAYLAVVYVSQRVSVVRTDPALEASAAPPSFGTTSVARAPRAGGSGTSTPELSVAGAVHVHTDRSDDAVGSLGDVAQAASASGLDFVFVTDHQYDLSLPIPAPTFAEDVLLLIGQERGFGREGGRVLVQGVDTVLQMADSTFKIGAVASQPEVLVVISHPRSTSEDEVWRWPHAWGAHAWEAFNIDDEAARRLAGPTGPAHVAGILASVLIGRGSESVLRFYSRGFAEPAAASFDSLYAQTPITALAALDVHPKLRALGRLWPSYEILMGTLANHVLLDAPLPDDPESAAGAVRAGIREGRVFLSLGETAAAAPFRLELTASGRVVAGIGGAAPLSEGMVLQSRGHGADGRLLFRVVRDGTQLGWTRGAELAWPVEAPGAYRVEVYRYGLSLGDLHWNLRPWIFTNPVRVLAPSAAGEASTGG